MPSGQSRGRKIVLLVEGKTEYKAVGSFLHRWLDPQLPGGKKVGINPINLGGAGNIAAKTSSKLESYLGDGRASFVFGLADLYEFPGLPRNGSVAGKVKSARARIREKVPKEFQNRFRQHFAVHETEAWLLSDPTIWPAQVRSQIEKKLPEQVNFKTPPAKFLKKLLPNGYKKTTDGRNKFALLDPSIAYQKGPYLKQFLDDLLEVAKRLQ